MTMIINERAGALPAGHAPRPEVRDFHARLPEFAPSPLTPAPGIAAGLGLGEVWVKDESSRCGLPSFKILGASWATYSALRQRAGQPFVDWSDVTELGELVRKELGTIRLAAATDGNHGRAVALMARWLGLPASIFVPAGTSEERMAAIRGEGASVTVVDGSYGAAVARSAEEAGADCLVISDTSWPGYTDVPQSVIEGYSTIFTEVDEQLGGRPDVVAVQIGVGAFAASAVLHYRSSSATPRMLGVEPIDAACVLASIQAGGITEVPGPHHSIMAGLNCDAPSLIAWPHLSGGVDVFVAISDDACRSAMRGLAGAGVVSGESGAAGLAGLTEVCRFGSAQARERLGLNEDARVLLVSTEGATDEASYRSILAAAAS